MSLSTPVEVERQLRVTTSAAQRTPILRNFLDDIDAIERGNLDSRTTLWDDAQASGLIDLMLDQLSQPWRSYADDIVSIQPSFDNFEPLHIRITIYAG